MKKISKLILTTFIFSTLLSSKLFCLEQKQVLTEDSTEIQCVLKKDVNKSSLLLEIDSDSVKVAEQLGGGIYYEEVDAIVPLFPFLVRADWTDYKNEIANRIGPIEPTPTKESSLWRNSATSINALVKDAKTEALHFLKIFKSIAYQTGCIANFGIEDQYMIKSQKSIRRKVQELIKLEEISEEESVGKVRDALRGTLIAETPEQITNIIQALKELSYEQGIEIVFINIWEEARPSGYVGIHAKMLLPISGHQKDRGTERKIIAEIQIHLNCIMDGTIKCVKEREHLLYDQMRKGGLDPETQTAASTLLYLTALLKCPDLKIKNDGDDSHNDNHPQHFHRPQSPDLKPHIFDR